MPDQLWTAPNGVVIDFSNYTPAQAEAFKAVYTNTLIQQDKSRPQTPPSFGVAQPPPVEQGAVPTTPLTQRQVAGEDIGGLLGSLVGLAVTRGVPLGAALRSIIGSVIGGGAGAAVTGGTPAQVSLAALRQGAYSLPGEAITKLLSRGGRALDKSALTGGLTRPLLDDIRVPGKPYATDAERRAFLYKQARQLQEPPVGVFGSKKTQATNEQAIEDLTAAMKRAAAASPATVDPTPLFEQAATAARSAGHAVGNYPDMLEAIARTTAKSKQDPLLGQQVEVGRELPPHIASQKNLAGMSAAVQDQVLAEFGEPKMEWQFKPDVPASDIHTVKTQTYRDLSKDYRPGASATEANDITFKKAGARQLAKWLNAAENVPGYGRMAQEESIRIPLRSALEQASELTWRAPTRAETAFAALPLITEMSGLTDYQSPYLASGALLGALHRPLPTSTLGRGLMKGASFLGRGVGSSVARLADYLARQPNDQ